ncbi:MAG TPA: DUF6691 family protein [Chitinophagaceae bacterium]|nr:DUF6691 family protein [Chitinophagaceae bacterium]
MNTDIKTFKAAELNTDFEVRSQNAICVNSSQLDKPLLSNLKFTFAGILFGIILIKSEVISWFRIQEMFRLQSFHMFGVIGSAIVVGIISVFIIKKFKIRSIDGEPIHLEPKKFNKGQVYGGLLFGFGWALTGACPGPLFAQIGTGATVIIVTLFSAIIGTWVYGYLREKLPH